MKPARTQRLRPFCLGWFLSLAAIAYPAAAPEAFYAEQYRYAACMDEVPIRRAPDMSSPRLGNIPKGAVVKADLSNGPWIRVIYKVPQGYTIGWSMAGLLCPLDPPDGAN